MRSSEDVEKLIRNAEMHSDPEVNQTVLKDFLHQFDKIQEQESAARQPKIRRQIMKSPITKLAVAAAIIVAVVFGLFEFISNDAGSGVVWAEVARKVEASPGVIFHAKETGLKNSNKNWPQGYTVVRRFPTLSRTDWYQAGQIRRTVFIDWEARTGLWLSYDAKVYSKKTLRDEDVRTANDKWTNPQALVSLVLSLEHRELGEKTINGVLCEGVETTDLNGWGGNFPIKSLVGQVWVSVETGYPVLAKGEWTGGDDGNLHQTATLDQFQWNVDFDESKIEPEIPSDYECID